MDTLMPILLVSRKVKKRMADLTRDLLFSGAREAVELALQTYCAWQWTLRDDDEVVQLFATFALQKIGEANVIVQAAWNGNRMINMERVAHLFKQIQTCVTMLAARTVEELKDKSIHRFRKEYEEACAAALLLQTTFSL